MQQKRCPWSYKRTLSRLSCPHPQLLPPRLRRFPSRAEMKRNRAELAPSKAPDFPAKAQRRCKDPTPKGTARVRAPPLEKPRQGGGAENRSAAAVAVDSSGPAPAAVAVPVAQEEERPLGWDDFGGWWWWGAEEEMLLGWFPFVEEDFSSQENMGGSGLFWEEEDYDIWQLQHIHEIPNQAKCSKKDGACGGKNGRY